MTRKILILTMVWMLGAYSVSLAAPLLINYQGDLRDSGGRPVTNPELPMTFRIFDAATGGVLQWTENQAVNVRQGEFNVILGGVTALNQAIFDNNNNLWIELQIDTDPPLTPRQRFASVPYALQANESDPTVNQLGKAILACSAGQVAKWNGASWNCADDNTGASVEADPTVQANVKDGVDWTELSGIPPDIADGDDIGIIAEVDPTVDPAVKDGVDWTELSGMPEDFADNVDNTGLLEETDPTVNALGKATLNCTTDQIVKWNGSAWACTNNIFTGIPAHIDVFKTSGTWIKPAGVDRVYVKVWGAGGDGAIGGNSSPGGGGGGGGYAEGLISVSGNVNVTVGTTSGATSRFEGDTTIQATGGELGNSGSNAQGGIGSGGIINLQGSEGVQGSSSTLTNAGGMGGSAPMGGAGGGGGVNFSPSGRAAASGTVPGGGGGGGTIESRPGGKHGDGLVIIMY